MSNISGAGPRSTREAVSLALKGFCMGAADVVPGVSGGTMALITGIYEELIYSIKSVNLTAIRHLLRFRMKDFLETVRWRFLLTLVVGILTAILTLARGLQWLLANEPVFLWAFFFGLVLASVFTVRRHVASWDPQKGIVSLLAAVFSYVLVGLVPVQTPEAAWFVFLSGVVAICAMILPGISGSFILLLLGKYRYILAALNNRDLVTIAVFSLGALVGILGFSRILSWVLSRQHDLTVAVLLGLMLGSLRKIWPWKETVSKILNSKGVEIPVEQLNVMPSEPNLAVFAAIGLAGIGFVTILLLDRLARGREN